MEKLETDDFKIEGGKKLSGSIETNTSKNGAVALIAASLLNKGTTTLHGIPAIEEVKRLLEILESIGVKTERKKGHTLVITPPKEFDLNHIDAEAAKRVRSVLMFIGPLLHHLNTFAIPNAGGCKMGERTIAAHRYAFEAMGATVKTEEDHYQISRHTLHDADVVMYEASDTATINALLAAACIPGQTTLSFASPNYQVQDVCFFLEKCGVKIDGIGTSFVTVHGVKEIDEEIEHWNSEDPIEAMMFISAAVTTHSELEIKRVPIDFLKLELLKLKTMGLKHETSEPYTSHNNNTKLVDITLKPSDLRALPDKIHALPYPGINTDNLPFFVPIATQVEGITHIHDWMWENRAIYFTELNKLGADITLADPHRVFITGPTELKGTQIVCPPALRPSMIILVAMLAAQGTSILRNTYAIRRGYENVVERLNSIGASIETLT